MNTNFSKRNICISVILAASIGSVVVLAVRGTEYGSGISGPPINQLYKSTDSTEETGSRPDSLMGTIRSAASAAGFQDSDIFAAATADAISIYSAPSIQDFIAWQESYGIVPFERWRANPERFQSSWDTLRATLNFATFSDDEIVVLPSSLGVTEQRSDMHITQLKSKSRSAAHPEITQAIEAGVPVETREVLLPGDYPTLGGEMVFTTLGIEMSKRPGTQEWVVTGFRHYAEESPPPRIALPPL